MAVKNYAAYNLYMALLAYLHTASAWSCMHMMHCTLCVPHTHKHTSRPKSGRQLSVLMKTMVCSCNIITDLVKILQC